MMFNFMRGNFVNIPNEVLKQFIEEYKQFFSEASFSRLLGKGNKEMRNSIEAF
jgi:hypothetical protein